VSVTAKQHALCESLEVVPDRQERLSIIVERGRRGVPLAPERRIPGNRVPGCVSPVWLIADCTDDRLFFRAHAEAPVVNGLVRLLCEIYDGATANEVLQNEPTLLEALDLMRDLSPTRRNGLLAVRRRMCELALKHSGREGGGGSSPGVHLPVAPEGEM